LVRRSTKVRLPAPAVCTNAEKAYIEEREGYLAFASVNHSRSGASWPTWWLVERRKRLYRLIKDKPTENRKRRYDALCIATRTGQAYKEWDRTHNKWGVPIKTGPDPHSREGIVRWCNKYVGVKEHHLAPTGASRIRPDWERRVYGGTGVPWCACFTVCSAWDAGIKGSGTASVQLNVNLARKGQGIYRGYTTDPAVSDPVTTALSSRPAPTPRSSSARCAYDVHRWQHRPEQHLQRRHGLQDRQNIIRRGQIVGWDADPGAVG
jgi:hypothetical protein